MSKDEALNLLSRLYDEYQRVTLIPNPANADDSHSNVVLQIRYVFNHDRTFEELAKTVDKLSADIEARIKCTCEECNYFRQLRSSHRN